MKSARARSHLFSFSVRLSFYVSRAYTNAETTILHFCTGEEEEKEEEISSEKKKKRHQMKKGTDTNERNRVNT